MALLFVYKQNSLQIYSLFLIFFNSALSAAGRLFCLNTAAFPGR